jgi:hypothetical protein
MGRVVFILPCLCSRMQNWRHSAAPANIENMQGGSNMTGTVCV